MLNMNLAALVSDRHDSHVRLYRAARGMGARYHREGSCSAGHAVARASVELAQLGDVSGPVTAGWTEQRDERTEELAD